eukprot:m51a1_g7081 putative 3 5 -cyclic nucleotide phosphodiesterase (830) ;mRNA; f:3650-7111
MSGARTVSVKSAASAAEEASQSASCDERNRRRRREVLRVRALQATLVLTVVCCIVGGVVAPWLLATRSAEVSVRKTLVSLVASAAEGTRDVVLSALLDASLAAAEARDALERGLVDTADPSAVLRELLRVGRRFSSATQFVHVSVGYTDQTLLSAAYDRTSGAEMLQLMSSDDNATLRTWAVDPESDFNSSCPAGQFDNRGGVSPGWVAETIVANGTYWASRFSAQYPVEQVVVSHQSAVSVGGSVVGAVAVEIPLEVLSDRLQSVSLSRNSRLVVVEAGGDVVAASTVDVTEATRVNALSVDDPIVAHFARVVAARASDSQQPFFVDEQQTSQHSTDIGGRSDTYILSHSYGLKWALLMAYSEKDYTASMRKSNNEAFAAGVCVLVGAPVVVGLVSWLMIKAVVLLAIRMEEKFELKTALDIALEKLSRVQEGQLGQKAIDSILQSVIDLLSKTDTFLFVDQGGQAVGGLDSDQKEWLDSEMLGKMAGPRAPTVSRSTSGLARGPSKSVSVSLCNSDFDRWSFDVWRLEEQPHPLVAVAMEALSRHGLVDHFHMNEDVLTAFLKRIEGLYLSVPYHNVLHACDVTQAVHSLLCSNTGLGLDPLEHLALLLSAVYHDVGHPGKNNAFQIEAETDLAMLYNDSSVLENYHLSVLACLTPEQQREFRRMSISLIMGQFNALCQASGGELLLEESAENRMTVMKAIIKLADVNNVSRTRKVMLPWAHRIFEEQLRQGDEEGRMGLPMSVYTDRRTARIERLQANFAQFVTIPMLRTLGTVLAIEEPLGNLLENADYWAHAACEQVADTEPTPHPAEAAAANPDKERQQEQAE